MNERFAKVDERFAELHREMNERFAKVDERFAELHREMNERFAKVDERFMQVEQQLDNFRTEIIAEIRGISSRYGKRSEAAARRLAREVLKAEGIDPNRIQHVSIKDEDGTFFEGYTTDLDILYVSDQECWFIEYKITCNSDDVAHFDTITRLAEKNLGVHPTRRIIMTIRVSDETKAMAQRAGIEVWHVLPENPRPFSPPPSPSTG